MNNLNLFVTRQDPDRVAKRARPASTDDFVELVDDLNAPESAASSSAASIVQPKGREWKFWKVTSVAKMAITMPSVPYTTWCANRSMPALLSRISLVRRRWASRSVLWPARLQSSMRSLRHKWASPNFSRRDAHSTRTQASPASFSGTPCQCGSWTHRNFRTCALLLHAVLYDSSTLSQILSCRSNSQTEPNIKKQATVVL